MVLEDLATSVIGGQVKRCSVILGSSTHAIAINKGGNTKMLSTYDQLLFKVMHYALLLLHYSTLYPICDVYLL